MKHTRRELVGALFGGALMLGGARLATAGTGEQLPEASSGGRQAGPLGPSEAVQTLASERPTAMIIPAAEVDAEVEINFIVDGQMLNPTGAWVVAWYDGTGLLHEKKRNMLFSGHVDYWNVGPSVFRNLASVPVGTPIELHGDKGGRATYAVEYVERVTIAQMTPEKMHEITAPTPYEAITIITCGGEFDYSRKEYLQRDVVRARLVSGNEQGTAVTPVPADAGDGESTPAVTDAPAGERTATVNEGPVNVRNAASTSGDVVTLAEPGAKVTITGEPVEADGLTWYPIRLEDGTEGFIASQYLDLDN